MSLRVNYRVSSEKKSQEFQVKAEITSIEFCCLKCESQDQPRLNQESTKALHLLSLTLQAGEELLGAIFGDQLQHPLPEAMRTHDWTVFHSGQLHSAF